MQFKHKNNLRREQTEIKYQNTQTYEKKMR